MDREMIRNELQEVFNMLDTDRYPEAVRYLTYFLDEGWLDDTVYDIATRLADCDPKEILPEFLFDQIVELYGIGIENGDENSMNDLGAFYYRGRNGEPDYESAVYYYKMAAENGSAQAQENLGYCYYYGRDVEKDYAMAFKYYSLGAFAGRPVSLYKIGDMYQNGYFVEKNEKQAFTIWNHCLDLLDDTTADFVAGPVFLRLGKALLHGKGTEANPRSALICFQKATSFLYDMVNDGESLYMGSLKAAIKGEKEAEEMLLEML